MFVWTMSSGPSMTSACPANYRTCRFRKCWLALGEQQRAWPWLLWCHGIKLPHRMNAVTPLLSKR